VTSAKDPQLTKASTETLIYFGKGYTVTKIAEGSFVVYKKK